MELTLFPGFLFTEGVRLVPAYRSLRPAVGEGVWLHLPVAKPVEAGGAPFAATHVLELCNGAYGLSSVPRVRKCKEAAPGSGAASLEINF